MAALGNGRPPGLDGLDNQLFVSRSLTALPSVDELRKVIQQDREAIESSIERTQAELSTVTPAKGSVKR